jgi:hypothetical protein
MLFPEGGLSPLIRLHNVGILPPRAFVCFPLTKGQARWASGSVWASRLSAKWSRVWHPNSSPTGVSCRGVNGARYNGATRPRVAGQGYLENGG